MNELTIDRTHVRVRLTGHGHDLPPVCLSIQTGAAHIQEYFTPEQAEQLVVMLAETARLARDDEFARVAP